ncbi:ribonuclease HII [Candidatus Bathyarchaeota archaeon]|nr:ribonuclease HII [Candidatus Bathyarchaeota archaeon]
MLVAGVDEAGRGCVIGPLIVAGVMMEEDRVESLKLLGVRDSKLLSPKKRERLRWEIEAVASSCAYFEIPPHAIDRVVEGGVKLRRLNYLEALAMARVIDELRPDLVYVDSSDVDTSRLAQQILRVMRWKPQIFCEHNADKVHPIVSAASILAKVRRDRIIEELRRSHGDFGSGYPSDKKTIEFLKKTLLEGGELPHFIRRSWKTVKRLLMHPKLAME